MTRLDWDKAKRDRQAARECSERRLARAAPKPRRARAPRFVTEPDFSEQDWPASRPPARCPGPGKPYHLAEVITMTGTSGGSRYLGGWFSSGIETADLGEVCHRCIWVFSWRERVWKLKSIDVACPDHGARQL